MIIKKYPSNNTQIIIRNKMSHIPMRGHKDMHEPKATSKKFHKPLNLSQVAFRIKLLSFTILKMQSKRKMYFNPSILIFPKNTQPSNSQDLDKPP